MGWEIIDTSRITGEIIRRSFFWEICNGHAPKICQCLCENIARNGRCGNTCVHAMFASQRIWCFNKIDGHFHFTLPTENDGFQKNSLLFQQLMFRWTILNFRGVNHKQMVRNCLGCWANEPVTLPQTNSSHLQITTPPGIPEIPHLETIIFRVQLLVLGSVSWNSIHSFHLFRQGEFSCCCKPCHGDHDNILAN